MGALAALGSAAGLGANVLLIAVAVMSYPDLVGAGNIAVAVVGRDSGVMVEFRSGFGFVLTNLLATVNREKGQNQKP